MDLLHVLLVEDNPADIDLTKEALETCKIKIHLNITKNGQEALDYLHHTPPFENTTKPDLILLDLHLPKKSGLEVLTEIKTNPETRHIPVVILTTSESDQDILKSYERHANCYITKPIDMNQFINVVQKIENFWFSIVKLPPKTP